MIFSSDIFYLRVFRDKIEVRNVKAGKEELHTVTNNFSNDRMLVADFETFESEIRNALKKFQKGRFLTPSMKLIFQPMEENVSNYSQVEIRSFRDSCEHTGAKEVFLYFGKDKLTDEKIINGMNSEFER